MFTVRRTGLCPGGAEWSSVQETQLLWCEVRGSVDPTEAALSPGGAAPTQRSSKNPDRSDFMGLNNFLLGSTDCSAFGVVRRLGPVTIINIYVNLTTSLPAWPQVTAASLFHEII